MKVAAHPLIVAAAFGLLGPAALSEDESRDHDCGQSNCVDAHEVGPSSEDFARIEAEWQAAVVRLDGGDLSVG